MCFRLTAALRATVWQETDEPHLLSGIKRQAPVIQKACPGYGRLGGAEYGSHPFREVSTKVCCYMPLPVRCPHERCSGCQESRNGGSLSSRTPSILLLPFRYLYLGLGHDNPGQPASFPTPPAAVPWTKGYGAARWRARDGETKMPCFCSLLPSLICA